MQLTQILFSQGFGSRRECAGLIAHGLVKVGGVTVDDPHQDFATHNFNFEVRGLLWPFKEKALILLHKPSGYECSQKPKHHPIVMNLLPAPLRVRNVQPIGRLAEDTTGALLMSDDGTLIHKLTSPKHHVPKVYEVACKHPVDARQVAALVAGVELHDETGRPTVKVAAAAAQQTGENSLQLTLIDGKYHQVKRMLAAVSNRVEGLHRSAFGAITIPPELKPGQWMWVEPAQVFDTESKS